jgi:aerobic-type carbon monoxide dehydrogenase small subunit (CoxS/CutS family)
MATALTINGRQQSVQSPPDEMLLNVLREELQLTGAKYGCGEGQCGACTVLVEGKPVRSCRIELSTVAGKKVTTIEGLEQDGRLHPVQQAFLDQEAFQCAYCTSGMIVSAVGLLGANPAPSESDIVRYMNGNICRCGAHPRIVAAIQQAARGSAPAKNAARNPR